MNMSRWILANGENLHVRLPERADRLLRCIIVTPDLHCVHHSAWRPETNSNSGAVFPVWDLIVGTFRATPRDGREQMRLAVLAPRVHRARRPAPVSATVYSNELTVRSAS